MLFVADETLQTGLIINNLAKVGFLHANVDNPLPEIYKKKIEGRNLTNNFGKKIF
jgi:hypothetical protein